MQVVRIFIEDNCPVIELSDGSRHPVTNMVWSRPAEEYTPPVSANTGKRYFRASNEITVSITYSPVASKKEE